MNGQGLSRKVNCGLEWYKLVHINKNWTNLDKKIGLDRTDLTLIDLDCLMTLQKMPNATL